MSNTIFQLLAFLIEASVIIPFFVGVRLYRKFDSVARLLFTYVSLFVGRMFITVPNDIRYLFLGESAYPTIFIYNWHHILTTFTIFLIYNKLAASAIWRRVVQGIIILYGFFILLDVLQGQTLTNPQTVQFSNYSYTAANVLIIGLALYYFFYMLQNLMVSDILKYSLFWMNAGFLFYYACSMFLYVYVQTATAKNAQAAWAFNLILSLVLYTCLYLAFYNTTNRTVHYAEPG